LDYPHAPTADVVNELSGDCRADLPAGVSPIAGARQENDPTVA
jgi:hypothetical protein